MVLIARAAKTLSFMRFSRAARNPRRTQEAILRKIITANRNTAFGREHGFSRIRSIEDFQQAVPLRNAAQYKPYLDACYAGESAVLTEEDPYFFAMTAGSTGTYKYIPMTKQLQASLDQSVRTWLFLLERQFPEARSAPVQFLVGSADGGTSPGGTPQGFVSGHNYKTLPNFLKKRFVVPYWVFTLGDAEDRYYAIGRFLATKPDLIAIAAISPLNIVNVSKALIDRRDMFIQDLRNGTLTLHNSSPEPADLPSQPELADRLAAWDPNTQSPAEFSKQVLPGLKLYATWLGGNMGHVHASLVDFVGDHPTFEMPFSASEGIFGIPYQLNSSGSIAAITSHFLEYIPEDEIDAERPKCLCAWELEEDKFYYQVVTTAGGLYRYSMEDLIRVKGRWQGLPVVEFISKKARQVSISNERLTERDVVEAYRNACAETGFAADQFLMFPSSSRHYKMVVENAQGDLAGFAQALDAALCHQSMGYDFEREDKLLDQVEAIQVAPGDLSGFLATQQTKSALPNAQVKPLHLSAAFDGAEQFQALARARPLHDPYG